MRKFYNWALCIMVLTLISTSIASCAMKTSCGTTKKSAKARR